MLNARGRRSLRRGLTIVELLVAMVIGGLVLGLVTAVSVRQQRIIADLSEASALSAQIREAGAVLPVDLRGASSVLGDIRDARDTALEVRGTIASGVVCDTTGGVLLAPAVAGAGAYTSVLRSIDAGDTAWVLTPNDSSEDWRPYEVTVAWTATPGPCPLPAPQLPPAARTLSRMAMRLTGAGFSAPSTLGMPVRVTRPLRYSIYRGTDGSWYLGERDWNTATLRLNAVQPVSGPYLPPAQDGLTFQYADSTGTLIPTPVANTRAIVLVHVSVRGQTRDAPRALAAAGSTVRRDSSSIWILLHNWR